NLPVGADRAIVDDNLDVGLRDIPRDGAGHFEPRLAFRFGAENQLVARIVLAAEGGEVFVGPDVEPADRLQDRYWRARRPPPPFVLSEKNTSPAERGEGGEETGKAERRGPRGAGTEHLAKADG